MHLSDILVASIVAPLVVVHGVGTNEEMSGVPNMFEISRILRKRAPIVARTGSVAPQSRRHIFGTRQTNQGASTRNDPRPQKGNIAYGGSGIFSCQKAGTVAITYDDGPNTYTDQVLDHFAEYGFKATFFVVGNNGNGAIDSNPSWTEVIRRMVAEGHQVASHTWSHADLSIITDEQRYEEMVKTELAIRNIIGKYPTYMRPPYSSCNEACQNIMKGLGYVIAYYDLETDDWRHQSEIQVSKDIFKNLLDATGGGAQSGDRLVLAHDVHEATVTSLTPFMLQYLKEQGYRGVTLGECLGEPEENWYRTSTVGS